MGLPHTSSRTAVRIDKDRRAVASHLTPSMGTVAPSDATSATRLHLAVPGRPCQ